MSDSYIFRKRPGFVYIVGNKKHGLYKIGSTTRTVEIRMAEFAPKLPFEIEVLGVIKSEDAPTREAEIHNSYNHRNFRDDWFVLSDEEVANIISEGITNDI